MNWLKNLLIRIFVGKKVIKTYKLGEATAKILLDNDSIYYITRKGFTYFRPNVITGEQSLKMYLSEAKSLLQSDDGIVFPVHKVRKIEISVKPYEKEEIEYE